LENDKNQFAVWLNMGKNSVAKDNGHNRCKDASR
jgi:hypothetical protein